MKSTSKFNRLKTLPKLWGVRGILAAGLILSLPASAQAPPNNVEATTSAVNKPAGVTYDAAGNLYIAALNDHVIRKVDLNGIITTVAGTGDEGFGGDGGPATSAQLDSPAGVALDVSGALYIADSHNHRIRKVVAGVITTLAGTGVPGFSGDGAAATAAQLNLPVALSIDAAGNVYIADANNHRIRKITGATITTIAGDGEEFFSGDNGPAIAAGLDTPNGVAADTLVPGKFYIGDTHNQRVRVVDASGTITTFAGTGVKTYTGDGVSAAAATLARPRGLAVGSNGTVYIADSDNNRVRSVAGGTIATTAGNGDEGFSGDTGLAPNAAIDTPRAAAVGPAGNIAITDTGNQRIRAVALNGVTSTVAGIAPTVAESLMLSGPTSTVYGTGALTATFADGVQTATGSLTLVEGAATISTAALSANTASLSLATLATGKHILTATYPGDSNNAPIASGVFFVNVTQGPLIASANAVQILYGQPVPTLTGTLTGVLPADAANVTAVFSTTAVPNSPVGTYPVAVALTGSAASKYTVALAPGSGSVVIAQAGTAVTLTTSAVSSTLTTPVTFKATVASLTTGTPTGSVQFFNGSTSLATVPLTTGSATLTTPTLPLGVDSITARYTGWQQMGSPQSPTLAQVAQLRAAAQLHPTAPELLTSPTLTTTLPRQAVLLVHLTW